jgi:hypothetical protein
MTTLEGSFHHLLLLLLVGKHNGIVPKFPTFTNLIYTKLPILLSIKICAGSEIFRQKPHLAHNFCVFKALQAFNFFESLIILRIFSHYLRTRKPSLRNFAKSWFDYW